MLLRVIGVRAKIHLGGVKPSFARMANANCLQPTSRFGGVGGAVVAEIVRDFQGVVAGICSVNCNNIPLLIRVNQTCIVFCPNSLDSLPELMSTNCPNRGGGGQLPHLTPRPVRLCYGCVV